jgi:hypothetical protein
MTAATLRKNATSLLGMTAIYVASDAMSILAFVTCGGRQPVDRRYRTGCNVTLLLRGCLPFHIGVENGLPSVLSHFPNRSGIEGT